MNFDIIKLDHFKLTLSWRRPLSNRNQPIDLLRESMDWFLYDNGLRHERVKRQIAVFPNCGISICKPLQIFQNCSLSGKFPSEWKKSNVVPTFKKGDKKCIKNYLLFSLLPVCGKVFEPLLYNNLFSFFFFRERLIIAKTVWF